MSTLQTALQDAKLITEQRASAINRRKDAHRAISKQLDCAYHKMNVATINRLEGIKNRIGFTMNRDERQALALVKV